MSALQFKTQFQEVVLNLSNIRSSTIFSSNIIVTDTDIVDSEIVRLNVTSHSIFGKGILTDNIECTNDITIKNGKKLIFYDTNVEAITDNISSIYVTRDDTTLNDSYLNYYSNMESSYSGHRFYNKTKKVLEINNENFMHTGKTAVLCSDQVFKWKIPIIIPLVCYSKVMF